MFKLSKNIKPVFSARNRSVGVSKSTGK